MKIWSALFTVLLCPLLKATNPDITTVQQPTNLVGDSVPGCIPLTQAVCYANYNSGIHAMIAAPHPFIGGAKWWQKGTESNSNLASVFGISLKFDFFPSPAEIHIRDWDIPPYSPHTKAEVLAATIHCLLLSCHATKDQPLEVQITTENIADQVWAKPFAKKYIRLPGQDGKPVTPTPVGDSFIKTDGFGIPYVISPKLNPKHQTPKITPVILPMEYGYDENPPFLDPYWPGTNFSDSPDDPLQSLALPRGHFYNLFSGPKFQLELNPLFGANNSFSISAQPKEDVVEVRMAFGKQTLRNVISGIASAALTARLNYGKPMTITIESYLEDIELMTALLKTPGWKETLVANRPAATSTFDYDPKTQSFTTGTLPGGVSINANANGRLSLKQSEK